MIYVTYVIVILHSVATGLTANPLFSNGHKMATVTSNHITEASGLAASKTHTGILYTHNDHGDEPYLYAIDSATGHRVSTITVKHAHNSDWEDIAYGPCPGGYCIYIADTGESGSKNMLYMVREPANILKNQDVDVYKKLHFSWTELDCETLLVDPQGEVYIISKVKGKPAKAAHVPRTGWNSGTTVTLTDIITLSFNTTTEPGPTGGDLSPNGKELLVITRHKMYYWKLLDGDVLAALVRDPVEVPHAIERQGEAVCWDAQGSGYYTLSEGNNEPLYYYSRQRD